MTRPERVGAKKYPHISRHRGTDSNRAGLASYESYPSTLQVVRDAVRDAPRALRTKTLPHVLGGWVHLGGAGASTSRTSALVLVGGRRLQEEHARAPQTSGPASSPRASEGVRNGPHDNPTVVRQAPSVAQRAAMSDPVRRPGRGGARRRATSPLAAENVRTFSIALRLVLSATTSPRQTRARAARTRRATKPLNRTAAGTESRSTVDRDNGSTARFHRPDASLTDPISSTK